MKKLLLTAALMLGLQGATQAAPAKLFASNLANGIAPSNGLVGLSAATVRFGFFPDGYDFTGKSFTQLNTDFTQVAQSTAPLSVAGQRGFFDLGFDYDTGVMDGKKIYVWILNGTNAATAPQQAIFSTDQSFVTPDGIFPNHSFVSPDSGAMGLVAHIGDLADGSNIGGVANAHTTVGENYRITGATASRTPEDSAVFERTSVTFTAIADSSFSGVRYQWRLNGKNIPKANNSTLVIPSATIRNSGNYDCVVTDDTIVVTTNVVSLVVRSIKPTFTTQPLSDVVALGSSITIGAEAVSPTGVNYQWRKGAALLGATDPQIEIANARPDDAGAYVCVATNAAAIQGGGFTNSLVAEVVVIDTQARAIAGATGGTVKLDAIFFGKAARFQWKRNGVNLTNGGQFAGATARSLSIKGLSNTNDGDVYTCEIFAGNAVAGFDSLESGEFTLSVFTGAPTFATADNPIILPPATLGADYTPFQIPANGASVFAVKGLPKGLVCNAATGIISGRPTALNRNPADPFQLEITLTNGRDRLVRPARITVNPILENLQGLYTGVIDRTSFTGGYSHTNNLGGRVQMTVTALGGISGSLTLGDAKVVPFTGFFSNPGSASPQATIFIRRPGLNFVPLEFLFTVQTPDAGDSARKLLTSATLRDAFLVPGQTVLRSTNVTGWRRKFDAKNPTATYPGAYNIAVTASGDSASRPRGASMINLGIKADGSVAITGTTADGEKLTGSTFVGPTGQVALFNLFYAPLRGSLSGSLQLNPGDAVIKDTVAGTLSWRRPAATSTRTRAYQSGFNLVAANFTVAGGRYATTDRTRRIFDLTADTDVDLEFSDAGLSETNTPARPDISVKLLAGNKLSINGANPRLTKLTVNAAKGTFNGTFTYDGAANRSVKFQGHVIRNGGEGGTWQGFGWFMLTQNAGTNTDPVQSGLVTLSIP